MVVIKVCDSGCNERDLSAKKQLQTYDFLTFTHNFLALSLGTIVVKFVPDRFEDEGMSGDSPLDFRFPFRAKTLVRAVSFRNGGRLRFDILQRVNGGSLPR